MPLCQQLGRRDDVAEALRHLLGAHVDEAVVHPEARERRSAVGAAALRDLVLVVREDEVEPAAVDVDRLAQMSARSSPSIRCASRAGRGPRASPSRSRLPRSASTARSRPDRACTARPRRGRRRSSLAVAAAEHAVIADRSAPRRARGPRPHRRCPCSISRSIIATIGADFLRRVRRDVGRRNAERAHVLEIVALVALGDHRRLDAFRLGRGDDLVVDVGDVAGIDEAVLRRTRAGSAARACRTPPPAAHCRYARGRRRSGRTHTW